jgi:membrane-bound metal-dependent hydrolase YbcI (DUF457 family)
MYKIAFMDPVAHSLAGTLIGRTNPSNKRGLVLACVLGALAPDIDIILTFWGHDTYITEHRGFTHSFLGFLPVTLLSAWVAWLFIKRKADRATFWALSVMAGLGVASHLFLDWCTSWGTMLLWPDRTRFAGDTMFIIDLWYTACLALFIILSVFFNKRRAVICAVGLMVIGAYHGLAAYNHFKALKVAETDRPLAWRAAFPQPLSPFRWEAFNRQDELLRGARLDFLKSPQPLEWQEWRTPPMNNDINAVFQSPQGKKFLWFSRVPVWSEEKLADGSVKVTCWDMMFYSYFFKDQVNRHFKQVFTVKDGQVTGGGFDH